MTKALESRDHIVRSLREDLLGPLSSGKELDCTKDIVFEKLEDSYGPWIQKDSGEEILQAGRPTRRYGCGILFPTEILSSIESDITDSDDTQLDPPELTSNIDDEGANEEMGWEEHENVLKKTANRDSSGHEDETEDFDIVGINEFHQSSMGISFLARIPEDTELFVEAKGGRYRRQTVTVNGQPREWWLRTPVEVKARFTAQELLPNGLRAIRPPEYETQNCEDLNIVIEVYSRSYNSSDPQMRMLTVCLVNRTPSTGQVDEQSLFQSWFRVGFEPEGIPKIQPYPSLIKNIGDEEESLSLLYRSYETFGVGHGCAADWTQPTDSTGVNSLTAEAIPECEVPSITPNVLREDMTNVEVSMKALGGLLPDDDGLSSLKEVISLYRSWINSQKQRVDIPAGLSNAAKRHLINCTLALTRMEEGLALLETDPLVLQAFQLANHAVLLQQLCSVGETRRFKYDKQNKKYTFSTPYSEPNITKIPPGKGSWRPFQIAFLLISLSSTANPSADDRETVDLLWFPTGGGKTEAYLGLTAFSIFLRRLKNPEDSGTQVLMRYTLRLLTSQQFQRASSLICAMEIIRQKGSFALGTTPFSIGLWLGGRTTPNTNNDAKTAFNSLKMGRNAETSFAILECPWCRAQIGPHTEGPRNSSKVAGYKREGDKVLLACSDNSCCFFSGLPLYVVDENIYEVRPDLVIGTVDKFARLSWSSEPRRLFGLNKGGAQEHSPPGLIIQDELHLISGPLGSMVGLYEGLIEYLCTDQRGDSAIKPKIISSTATIRRSEQQILSLYGRETSALFPPPGIDAGDSFFSSFAKNKKGELAPGKKFVGVYTPNLPSLQTAQIRTFSSLLQSPAELEEVDQDPWWTLMAFFNSLRELGNTLSLLQTHVPNYLRTIRIRSGIDRSKARWLNSYIELTGRLRDEEITPALSKLSIRHPAKNQRALDACLASNIIEVGIDVPRLALMVVVGQPKTTSQYIQVTGRVGRQWEEVPGLIVTLYGVGRPRDRSHFEKFRSYHERLYANVEPTSVTPFATPVLERALHACLIGFTRQFGDAKVIESPDPFPRDLANQFKATMLQRISNIDPDEIDNFEDAIDKCIELWKKLQRTQWGKAAGIPNDNDLMVAQGSYIPLKQRGIIWPTPTSLRGVDAECEMQITQLYLKEPDDV